MAWNDEEYAIDVTTGLGATIQVGQETMLLFYNNTGIELTDGKFIHATGGTTVGAVSMPSMEIADASIFSGCNGTIACTTHIVAIGAIGLATYFGKVREYDTTVTGVTPGVLWLSTDGSGDPVSTKPVFPNYAIALGVLIKVGATGEMFVSVTSSVEDTFNDSWDGSIRESFNFRTSSDGVTITGVLTNDNVPADDLTLLFSDGFYTLDVTTAPLTIALIAGSATIPQTNYVYIPNATKVLTVSTSGWPVLEHCKIATIAVFDVVTTQSNGTIRNQNWNDHIKSDSGNGHILHITERMRALASAWETGGEATLSGNPTNVYISTTEAKVYQMHLQTFIAHSMPTDNIHVVNDFTTPYRTTTNLNTITVDANGDTLSNRWFSFVIWGVANKTGEISHLMCNLPTGSYNSEARAITDVLGRNVYDIPKQFNGVGFLIAKFVIRGGVWTYNSGVGYQDLRGLTPNATAGSGTGSSGITSFTGLTDTPSAYTSQALKTPKVNAGETALEFVDTTTYEKALLVWDGDLNNIATTELFDLPMQRDTKLVSYIPSALTGTYRLTRAYIKVEDLDNATGNNPNSVALVVTKNGVIVSGAATTLASGVGLSITNMLTNYTTATTWTANDSIGLQISIAAGSDAAPNIAFDIKFEV